MSKIYTSADQLIGHTPLLKSTHIGAEEGLKVRILTKLEYSNSTGPMKDRAAYGTPDDVEQRGVLKKGSVITEPTSDNTGISLVSVATAGGYRTIIMMPDSMSVGRKDPMGVYGAELVLTEGAKGMKGVMAKMEELAKEILNSFIPRRLVNPVNSATYEKTTGPEVWEDTDGEVDYSISGIGTGGTPTGMGHYLYSKKPGAELIAAEPNVSPVFSGGQPGPYEIQGLGAGFVSDTLGIEAYDEVIRISNEDAFRERREIEGIEGILTGTSSGAALYVAV